MSQEPQQFILVLTPLTSGWRAPVEVRLRQALKLLLRGFGFKAVSIKPETKNETDVLLLQPNDQ
jgi:hypothetical protein